MLPKFYLSTLRAKVDVIGTAPPELEGDQAGFRPIVTLVVETDDNGYVIMSIRLDYLNSSSAIRRGSPLGSYSWSDYPEAYKDAETLAKYWRRPLIRATRDRGWVMVATGVEIDVGKPSDLDAKTEP